MRSGVLTLLAVVCLSASAFAQLLHGHPQLAAYPDPSFYPTISAQGHWAPSENPIASDPTGVIVFDLAHGTLGNSTLGHTHLDLVKCPLYAELTAPIVCNFAVKLFHSAAVAVFDPALQEGARDIVWDAGATPTLRCDPTSLCVWTGHLTLDPALGRWATPHGWWSPLLSVKTFFDNGDKMDTRLFASFYSMLDPTAPDTGGHPFVESHTAPLSARHPNDVWGDNFVQAPTYLPIAPIDQPYPEHFNTAGYGGQLFDAVFEQRADLDLHNHVGGTLLKTVTQTGDLSADVVYDPAVLGAGVHKMAILRNQLSSEGNDAVNTLLVFDVIVGPSFPAPTTCQDATATNFGGPLPCVFPPPPCTTCACDATLCPPQPTDPGELFVLCAKDAVTGAVSRCVEFRIPR